MIKYYIAKVPNISKWSLSDAEAVCASYSEDNMKKALNQKNENNEDNSIKFIMLSQKIK